MKQKLLLLRLLVGEGYRCARWSLKVAVELRIGKKLYADPWLKYLRQYHYGRVKFYWQCFLHWLGLSRIRAITYATCEIGEGPGSQAFSQMGVMNFAHASGLVYVHTPFIVLAGADRPMRQWASLWESTFNLGFGERPCTAASRGVVNCAYNSDVARCFGWNQRREELTSSFKTMLPEFRRKYYANKLPRTASEVTVAINIRRGEVTALDYTELYTSSEKITRIAIALKSLLDAKGICYRIRVYGQGDTAEFANLLSLGVEFFLNADPAWTLQELVEADILVVAKSHFSYYAGFISDGIKIFEPSASAEREVGLPGQPPAWGWRLFSELEDWLPCEEDGAIDTVAFERQLSLLMQSRRSTQNQ